MYTDRVFGYRINKDYPTHQSLVSCNPSLHEFVDVCSLEFLACLENHIRPWKFFALAANI